MSSKISEKVKLYFKYLLIAFIISLFFWGGLEILSIISSVLCGTIFVHWKERKKYAHKYFTSSFNEEYYDLYWNYHLRLLSLFTSFYIALFILVDKCRHSSNEAIAELFNWGMCNFILYAFLMIPLSIVLAGLLNQSKIMGHLYEYHLICERGSNFLGEYTEKEKEILKKFLSKQ